MGGLRSYTISQTRTGQPVASPVGFTIIEVLIVLAITSFMFIGGISLINGKQANTSFSQSIRNIQSELEQVINDVGSGYYINSGTIKCDSSPGGPVMTVSGTPVEQGSNGSCIFMGKALHFAVAGADPEAYNVYTIAGLRNNDSLSPFTAKAKLVAKPTVGSPVPNVYETKRLQYGMTIVKMYYDGDVSNQIGAFAVVSAPSGIGNADGSQQVNFVALADVTIIPKMSATTAVNKINGNWSTATDKSITSPPKGIQICFRSGGSQQSGLMTLGALGRQGTVDLKIFSNVSCTP